MSNRLISKIEILDSRAKIPEKAHSSDTGYDIKAIGIKKIIGDVIFFKTGLRVQPPKGYYFEIFPRSSISKLPLAMANSVGVMDEGYRGEWLLPVRILHSDLGRDFKNSSFPNGLVKIFGLRPQTMMSLAKLILAKKPILFQAILRKKIECKFVEEKLDSSERMGDGFGSTDK